MEIEEQRIEMKWGPVSTVVITALTGQLDDREWIGTIEKPKGWAGAFGLVVVQKAEKIVPRDDRHHDNPGSCFIASVAVPSKAHEHLLDSGYHDTLQEALTALYVVLDRTASEAELGSCFH